MRHATKVIQTDTNAFYGTCSCGHITSPHNKSDAARIEINRHFVESVQPPLPFKGGKGTP